MSVCLLVCLSVCILFLCILDLAKEHELYCVTKTATYCLSVPLFVHFSFSPMEISVTDFSAPIGASVFKFCVHLQEQINGNLLILILPSFFIFSFFPSFTLILLSISQQLLQMAKSVLCNVHLQEGKVYCVNGN